MMGPEPRASHTYMASGIAPAETCGDTISIMLQSTLPCAPVAAFLCLALPYLTTLLSQLSLGQRLAFSIAIYLVVSAKSQRRSSKRFRADQHVSPTRPIQKVSPRISSSDNEIHQSSSSDAQVKLKPPSPAVLASVGASKLPQIVAHIRTTQCPQLIDACYLDAAAAPAFPSGLVNAVADELSTKLLSNPHSKSPSAISTADQIASIRLRVMRELFGIEDTHNWHLVFTSGTTASLKLVGETFDWPSLSRSLNGMAGFSYLLESHTSAVGIRELAARAGVAHSSFTEEDSTAKINQQGLVVLPLQCNATGRRYADLLKRVCSSKGKDAIVMVDAASYLSSAQRLDLSEWQAEETPDMVAFSFYKIFGYPTGLGGLLVKNSVTSRLCNKAYYGGGTVDSIIAESRWTKPRKDFEARLEDGTVNIHGIIAVDTALDYYRKVFGSWNLRGDYVVELRSKLVRAFKGLTHGNGNPVVKLYSVPEERRDFGPIVNFNVLAADGSMVSPQEVDRLASISNIHLRMGRHCNPGFVTSQLGVTPDRIKQEYADGVGCDDAGDSALEGSSVASASLRASLSLLNTEEDIERLVGFIARFFLSSSPSSKRSLSGADGDEAATERRFKLANITVYPIKSCAGQALAPYEAWKLTRHGLEYDREWIVMNLANGKALSQKRFPKMALIRPRIDLSTRTMTISIADTTTAFTLALDDDSQYNKDVADVSKAEICGVEVSPRAHRSETLRSMLTTLLGVSCTVARQATGVSRHSKLDTGSEKVPLIFSNESPFLLINSASVEKVSAWIQEDSSSLWPSLEVEDQASDSGYSSASHFSKSQPEGQKRSGMEAQAASFRANLLISPSGAESAGGAFSEDGFSRIVLGGKHVFGVLGECRRCQMVCVDQRTGEVKPQTLKTLAKYRRNARGRIIFGSHLSWLPDLARSSTSDTHNGAEDVAKVWVGMEALAS